MADIQLDYLKKLNGKFGPYLERYGRPTVEEREALRCTEPTDDLVACHQLVSEELESILKVLDQYDYNRIPEEWRSVANLVLFLAEIDTPVVKWVPRFHLAHLPDALDPRHFEAKRNFNDMEPGRGRTLLAIRVGSANSISAIVKQSRRSFKVVDSKNDTIPRFT